MRKLLAVLFLTVLMTTASACYRHTYTTGTGAAVRGRAPTYLEWQSHFLFGLIGEYEVPIDRICPSGNATVKDRVGILNGLIGALTFFLYMPTTVVVYCGEASAPAPDGT